MRNFPFEMKNVFEAEIKYLIPSRKRNQFRMVNVSHSKLQGHKCKFSVVKDGVAIMSTLTICAQGKPLSARIAARRVTRQRTNIYELKTKTMTNETVT